MNKGTPALPPLALIAGPTASGKSALALALAKRRGGVIINADSAQVYRDLSLLTARPTQAEKAEVPHALYGYRDGAEPCSAADWAVDAKAAIAQAHAQGRLPILVGGTGLYVRTLLEGIAPVPSIDPAIRAKVRALPIADAFLALESEDPEAASRLRPGDGARVARALEVVRSTGEPLAHWQQERAGGIGDAIALYPLLLLPPRAWLHQRIDRRFDSFLSEEGLAEVSSLLERNLSPTLSLMRAIGVPQISAYLRGELTRDEALAAGRAATRQYAKRQYTWFSHQPPAAWPRCHEPLNCEGVGNALAEFDARLPR